jgi:hypothetical protein
VLGTVRLGVVKLGVVVDGGAVVGDVAGSGAPAGAGVAADPPVGVTDVVVLSPGAVAADANDGAVPTAPPVVAPAPGPAGRLEYGAVPFVVD